VNVTVHIMITMEWDDGMGMGVGVGSIVDGE